MTSNDDALVTTCKVQDGVTSQPSVAGVMSARLLAKRRRYPRVEDLRSIGPICSIDCICVGTGETSRGN